MSLDLAPTSCTCENCKMMCERPCWGTPQDIKKIIDAGYIDRLMLDYWVCYGDKDIEILCVALKGCEGTNSPFNPRSKEGCTFWENGLCSLHDKDLKPIEGKISDCERYTPNLHHDVAMTWDTQEGKDLIKFWKTKISQLPLPKGRGLPVGFPRASAHID